MQSKESRRRLQRGLQRRRVHRHLERLLQRQRHRVQRGRVHLQRHRHLPLGPGGHHRRAAAVQHLRAGGVEQHVPIREGGVLPGGVHLGLSRRECGGVLGEHVQQHQDDADGADAEPVRGGGGDAGADGESDGVDDAERELGADDERGGEDGRRGRASCWFGIGGHCGRPSPLSVEVVSMSVVCFVEELHRCALMCSFWRVRSGGEGHRR